MSGLTVHLFEVIFLAHKGGLPHDVELLPRGELLATDHAREALEVEHFVPRAAHQVIGGYPLGTTAALGPEPPETQRGEEGGGGSSEDSPEEVLTTEYLPLTTEALLRQHALTVCASDAGGVPRAVQHVV